MKKPKAPARRNTELVPVETPQPASLAELTGLRLDMNPARVYLGRLSPGSLPTMLGALKILAIELTQGRANWDAVPWHELRYQHTQAIRQRLAAKYAPATANRILSALRGVLEECMKLGLMSGDDYIRAAKTKSVKGDRVVAGRALTEAELSKLVAATSDGGDLLLARDRAMIYVLYGAGLRRSEVVALNVGSFDRSEGSLRVKGKGNKERKVFVGEWVVDALRDWIDLRGADDGPLFCAVGRYRHVDTKHRLTPQMVLKRLDEIADKAKVKHFGAHDMRRTFISEMLDTGADAKSIQELAGHASVVTTMRYDRRGERARKRAAQMLPSIKVPQPES